MACATSSPEDELTCRITSAPASASVRALLRPNRFAAPVTRTVLPTNLIISGFHLLVQWQFYTKCYSRVWIIANHNLSLVQLHNFLGKRESQSCSLFFGREERGKQTRHVYLCNSLPMILHGYIRLLRTRTERDHDFTHHWRSFNRILEEIQ